MIIVGSIGIFVKFLPFTSPQIAFTRAVIGSLFLLCCSFFMKNSFSKDRIKADFKILLLSGIALSVNWIFLFEAYKYTTVATATVCYYMAPVFVLLLSSILFKEALGLRQILCVIAAFVGILFVSGFWKDSSLSWKGIFFGLLAACFYAAVIILNKRLRRVDGLERSFLQLFVAALFLLPYTVFSSFSGKIDFSVKSLLLLLFVGVVHTGIVYLLFFSSMAYLPAQTVAVLSYLDPAVAILLSAVFLRESFGITEFVGSVLIIGSALVSEWRS